MIQLSRRSLLLTLTPIGLPILSGCTGGNANANSPDGQRTTANKQTATESTESPSGQPYEAPLFVEEVWPNHWSSVKDKTALEANYYLQEETTDEDFVGTDTKRKITNVSSTAIRNEIFAEYKYSVNNEMNFIQHAYRNTDPNSDPYGIYSRKEESNGRVTYPNASCENVSFKSTRNMYIGEPAIKNYISSISYTYEGMTEENGYRTHLYTASSIDLFDLDADGMEFYREAEVDYISAEINIRDSGQIQRIYLEYGNDEFDNKWTAQFRSPSPISVPDWLDEAALTTDNPERCE